MATFSATEIDRQSDRLTEEAVYLMTALRSAANTCETIATTVKSEDSSLASKWTSLGNIFVAAATSYQGCLDTMTSRMKSYAAKTKDAEAFEEGILDPLGQEIEKFGSWLQSVDL